MTWAKRHRLRSVRRVLPHDISDDEAEKIHAEAIRRLNNPKRLFWLVLALIVAHGAVFAAVNVPAIRQALQPVSNWLSVFAGALIGGAIGGLIPWLYTRPLKQHIRDVGSERGYSVCLSCGYAFGVDRRAMPHCPECGADRPGDG